MLNVAGIWLAREILSNTIKFYYLSWQMMERDLILCVKKKIWIRILRKVSEKEMFMS